MARNLIGTELRKGFMKALTAVFGVTTIVVGIAAAILLQQLHTERLRTHALQSRVTELELAQARQHASSPPAAVLQTPAPDVAPATPPSTAAAAVTADPAATEAAKPSAVKVDSTDLMKDPDFRASVAASLRQNIAQNFPDLAMELELSPEQARKLLDIIASSKVSAITMTSDGQGNTRVDTRGSEEAQARRDDEIRALLGESTLQQWRSYEQSLPVRQQVVRLRTTLESAGASLNQRQQRQLIAVMADERKQLTAEAARIAQATGGGPGGTAVLEQMIQFTDASNRRIIDASLAYLSPQQLDALKAQQNMDLASTRALLRTQRPRELVKD
jgi:hypothetical protein